MVDRLVIGAFLLFGLLAAVTDIGHGLHPSNGQKLLLVGVSLVLAGILAAASAYTLLVVRPVVFVSIALIALYLLVI